MKRRITRRRFFSQSFGLGAGALLFKELPAFDGGLGGQVPLIITSHTNATGKKAMVAGWEVIAGGGRAVDAVEKAANIIEEDPNDMSVGYGGFPNEDGVVQLDASIMDGKTYNAGAVACLENIKNPCSVARIVMERTDHILMVGRDALAFAKKWGFTEEDLLTEKAREAYLRRKENLSDRDDWGPPEHLKNLPEFQQRQQRDELNDDPHGTTNVLAVDRNGDVAGITTTSGLGFKIAGRVGDSPIIGAGLYVDNEVGAAGATGRGEDVIKSCASFYMVLRMKEGRTPQQACEDALRMIKEKYKKVNPDFLPGEQFVAINTKGELGACRMTGKRPGRISVQNASGYSIYTGTIAFPKEE